MRIRAFRSHPWGLVFSMGLFFLSGVVSDTYAQGMSDPGMYEGYRSAQVDSTIPFVPGAEIRPQDLRGVLGSVDYQQGRLDTLFYRFDETGSARFSISPLFDRDIWQVECIVDQGECLMRYGSVVMSLDKTGRSAFLVTGASGNLDLHFSNDMSMSIEANGEPVNLYGDQLKDLVTIRQTNTPKPVVIATDGIKDVIAYMTWILSGQRPPPTMKPDLTPLTDKAGFDDIGEQVPLALTAASAEAPSKPAPNAGKAAIQTPAAAPAAIQPEMGVYLASLVELFKETLQLTRELALQSAKSDSPSAVQATGQNQGMSDQLSPAPPDLTFSETFPPQNLAIQSGDSLQPAPINLPALPEIIAPPLVQPNLQNQFAGVGVPGAPWPSTPMAAMNGENFAGMSTQMPFNLQPNMTLPGLDAYNPKPAPGNNPAWQFPAKQPPMSPNAASPFPLGLPPTAPNTGSAFPTGHPPTAPNAALPFSTGLPPTVPNMALPFPVEQPPMAPNAVSSFPTALPTMGPGAQLPPSGSYAQPAQSQLPMTMRSPVGAMYPNADFTGMSSIQPQAAPADTGSWMPAPANTWSGVQEAIAPSGESYASDSILSAIHELTSKMDNLIVQSNRSMDSLQVKQEASRQSESLVNAPSFDVETSRTLSNELPLREEGSLGKRIGELRGALASHPEDAGTGEVRQRMAPIKPLLPPLPLSGQKPQAAKPAMPSPVLNKPVPAPVMSSHDLGKLKSTLVDLGIASEASGKGLSPMELRQVLKLVDIPGFEWQRMPMSEFTKLLGQLAH